MKYRISSLFVVISVIFAGAGAHAGKTSDKACHFSDMKKLHTHLEKHVTYPSTGKELKATCKKEWPDEFSKEERACFESKIKDETTYKDAGQVMKALGAKSG